MKNSSLLCGVFAKDNVLSILESEHFLCLQKSYYLQRYEAIKSLLDTHFYVLYLSLARREAIAFLLFNSYFVQVMPKTNEIRESVNNSNVLSTPDCESVIKISKATLEDIEFLRSCDGEDYHGVMEGLNRVIKYLISSTYVINSENAKELNEVIEHMRNIMWAGQFITNLSQEE